MRVLHVISTPEGVGGAETMLIGIVEAGTTSDVAQRVLNPFTTGRGEPELGRRLPAGSYRPFAASSIRELPRVRRWIKSEIERFRPDIVHAHLFHALVVVAAMKGSIEAPLVLSHQHGDRMKAQHRPIRRRLDRWAGARYDRVIACSGSVRDFLLKDYGYEPGRVTVIHNGWSGAPRAAVPVEHPTVVCVANFRPAKGHSVLIDAFRRVHDKLPDARLDLVGSGPLEQEIRDRVRSYGLDSAVSFAGASSDVWAHLASAHIFVLPSFQETGGVAAMEAMAAGLPVVASRVGGLPEAVPDGRAGMLVPPGDVAALGEAMLVLLLDASRREEMSREARRVADTLTMTRSVSRYFGLYEEVVTAGRARSGADPGQGRET